MIVTAVLVASTTSCPIFARTGGDVAQSAVSSGETAMLVLPATPKELLINIHSALAGGELLKETFYTRGNLVHFLGAGYRFTNDKANREISFDDGDNIYIDESGNLTFLGRNRPCLWRGSLGFDPGSSGHGAAGSIAMLTLGRSAGTKSTITADMVKEIFGEPDTVTEGVPTAPPPHGLPYVATPRTNELGNRWLTYQAELNGHLQYAKFRTLGDAAVVEIQLFEAQR